MLAALKTLFDRESDRSSRMTPGRERRHLQVAVAALLHEVIRVDLDAHAEEYAAAEVALADLFDLSREERAQLLEEGRARAQQLTSYFAPIAVIKRDLALAGRIRIIEHLWRIAYTDGKLDPYEDHFVRKIAHLLYVPNTESVLARNRARPNGK